MIGQLLKRSWAGLLEPRVDSILVYAGIGNRTTESFLSCRKISTLLAEGQNLFTSLLMLAQSVVLLTGHLRRCSQVDLQPEGEGLTCT